MYILISMYNLYPHSQFGLVLLGNRPTSPILCSFSNLLLLLEKVETNAIRLSRYSNINPINSAMNVYSSFSLLYVSPRPFLFLALQCSFTIVGRDSRGNNRFTAGSDEWEVTVEGVGDWAAQGRVGELVYSTDAPFSASGLWW